MAARFNFSEWDDSVLLDWLGQYQDRAGIRRQLSRASQEVLARATRFDGVPSSYNVRAIVAQYRNDPRWLTGTITWLGWIA